MNPPRTTTNSGSNETDKNAIVESLKKYMNYCLIFNGTLKIVASKIPLERSSIGFKALKTIQEVNRVLHNTMHNTAQEIIDGKVDVEIPLPPLLPEIDLSTPDLFSSIWETLQPILKVWAGSMKDGPLKAAILTFCVEGEKSVATLRKIFEEVKKNGLVDFDLPPLIPEEII